MQEEDDTLKMAVTAGAVHATAVTVGVLREEAPLGTRRLAVTDQSICLEVNIRGILVNEQLYKT